MATPCDWGACWPKRDTPSPVAATEGSWKQCPPALPKLAVGSIGITAPAVFPGRSGANRYVTDERPAATLTERIQDLLTISDAVVALPGSLGTLTELVVAWNLAFVAPFSSHRPAPIVALGPIWAELVPLLTKRLATNGDLVQCVATVEDAVGALRPHLDSHNPR